MSGKMRLIAILVVGATLPKICFGQAFSKQEERLTQQSERLSRVVEAAVETQGLRYVSAPWGWEVSSKGISIWSTAPDGIGADRGWISASSLSGEGFGIVRDTDGELILVDLQELKRTVPGGSAEETLKRVVVDDELILEAAKSAYSRVLSAIQTRKSNERASQILEHIRKQTRSQGQLFK